MATWDPTRAAAAADANAQAMSTGRCAEFTREAIEAGGVVLVRHLAAKDYGSSLTTVGFIAQTTPPVVSNVGDVGIVQPIQGHPDGHMAIFDGTLWVSDFKQQHGLYPGIAYRNLKPPFTIYRYPRP